MRLIDADALKADYGMKDDCKDCEKEIQGYVRECHYNAVYTKMDFCEWIDSAPTIEPERKWETCFDCPLSNGCPKIRGCTNEQAEGYASDIPDDCPLSIDPERKKGHWIVYVVSMLDGEDCKCSECGQISCAPYWNFCPNCGAKMENPEDIPMEYFENGGM